MRLFLRLEDLSTGLALRLSIAFLIMAASLAIYQVVMRFVFGMPSTWSEVITRSAMIWCVFLGVAVAFKQGAMIAVDVIQNALPRRLGLGLFVVSNVASLIFFSVLFWQGIQMTERVIPQRLAALDMSIAWVYAALPVGSVFIIIAIIASVMRAMSGGWMAGKQAGDLG